VDWTICGGDLDTGNDIKDTSFYREELAFDYIIRLLGERSIHSVCVELNTMTTEQKIRRLYNIPQGESHGFPEDEVKQAEAALGIRLPRALREYYLTLGKHEALNYCFNRLLKPDDEIGFSDDRYLVFYEENQVVAYWGIKEEHLVLPDPPVYGNYAPTFPTPDWHLENATTENFLLVMAIYNGCMGGLEFNANRLDYIEPATVKYIEENWSELKGITFESQRIFTDGFDEVVSLSMDDEQQCMGIFIGTSHRSRFDNLIDRLNVDWYYVSDEEEAEEN
jgi:hypothetical protein